MTAFQPSTDLAGIFGKSPATASDIVAAYGIRRSLANKIVATAYRAGIPDPAMLANVIRMESNFNPLAINMSSGAQGLLQFIPSTQKELGINPIALGLASAERQMDWVEDYFKLDRIKNKGPLRTEFDVFMAVFIPNAIGNPGYKLSERERVGNPGIYTAGDYYRIARGHAKLTPVEPLDPSTVWWAYHHIPVVGYAAGWSLTQRLAYSGVLIAAGIVAVEIKRTGKLKFWER